MAFVVVHRCELVAPATVALIAPIVLVDATFLTATCSRSSKAAGCRCARGVVMVIM